MGTACKAGFEFAKSWAEKQLRRSPLIKKRMAEAKANQLRGGIDKEDRDAA